MRYAILGWVIPALLLNACADKELVYYSNWGSFDKAARKFETDPVPQQMIFKNQVIWSNGKIGTNRKDAK